MGTYTHLTMTARQEIQQLKRKGCTLREIGHQVGVAASTICRELRRNCAGAVWHPSAAHREATARQAQPRRPQVICGVLLTVVNAMLRKEWSPEQIMGRLRLDGREVASHTTIYTHIQRDKAAGGTLVKHLRRRGKHYRVRGSGKRQLILGRVDISERPAVVDERSRIGDWEGDTVHPGNHPGAIVTMVERKSRFLIMAKCGSRDSVKIASTIHLAMCRWRSQVHTITLDNGLEFGRHVWFGRKLAAKVYFAKPHAPWQRGLNENTNGLVRQYIPKGTAIDGLTDSDVKKLTDKLNHRPRKCLDYKTPHEVFFAKNVALGT